MSDEHPFLTTRISFKKVSNMDVQKDPHHKGREE